QQEREALIAARLLIVQGRIGMALDLLDSWQRNACAGKRARSELEIMIVKAQAYFVDRRLSEAKSSLTSALTVAQNLGYTRLVLQEGKDMMTLLKEISPGENKALSAYLRGLLSAFATEQARNEAAVRLALMPFEDRLSPHEQRVFRLIAEGLSNPEIADELTVSLNTVKTQVKSIYRKLNLRSRKHARDTARGLYLL